MFAEWARSAHTGIYPDNPTAVALLPFFAAAAIRYRCPDMMNVAPGGRWEYYETTQRCEKKSPPIEPIERIQLPLSCRKVVLLLYVYSFAVLIWVQPERIRFVALPLPISMKTNHYFRPVGEKVRPPRNQDRQLLLQQLVSAIHLFPTIIIGGLQVDLQAGLPVNLRVTETRQR
uniref:Uncharacterized protein n=1 Tax=Caenorhabditis japonica TaxID=281687 RepID=A0A8R1I4J2_CAEJA